MLKISTEINKGIPLFSEFHYIFHCIEDVFLEFDWYLSDSQFYWPENHLPDFLKDEYAKPIPTNNGLKLDLRPSGFGIVSSEFMYTFYKNIWSDWIDIMSIKHNETVEINKKYLEEINSKNIEEIDLERHPILIQNIDAAFWVIRTKSNEIEGKILKISGKQSGIKIENIEKSYW